MIQAILNANKKAFKKPLSDDDIKNLLHRMIFEDVDEDTILPIARSYREDESLWAITAQIRPNKPANVYALYRYITRAYDTERRANLAKLFGSDGSQGRQKSWFYHY